MKTQRRYMDSKFFKIIKAQITFIIVGFLAIIAIIFGFFVILATIIFAPIISWINQSRNNNSAQSYQQDYEGPTTEQKQKQSGDFIDVEFEVIDEDDKKD